MDKYKSINISLHYENGKLSVLNVYSEPVYENLLKEKCCEPKKNFKSPFSFSEEFTTLENEIVNILEQKEPQFFKELFAFYGKYKDYSNNILDKLTNELGFYLSFFKFEREMNKQGFNFSVPHISEGDLRAEGLYDLALACKNISEGKPVIANSFELNEKESFFVLTGPNQGGKTTFARSLGQLIYFSKIGLFVPAISSEVPYFKNILTHFSVEESIETGRGKLKEELIRLSPMMQDTSRESFVIINELFTTAANYDACIMGTKVLKHFIDKQCRGIYVTHLAELNSAHESIVSLVACLDEEKKQSFKIERSTLEVKGCAINQVNKYKLAYADLKERLSL